MFGIKKLNRRIASLEKALGAHYLPTIEEHMSPPCAQQVDLVKCMERDFDSLTQFLGLEKVAEPATPGRTYFAKKKAEKKS